MDTNLKPLIEARVPKRSYKQPELFDINQTRSNLLALLSKLRSYLGSSTFQTSLTILDNLTHQVLKHNIHETLNSIIETYVNHSTQEKLDEALNSLNKASPTEDERKQLAEFSQKLETSLLDPISKLLELLTASENAREVLEGDIESAEARTKKILSAVLYTLHAWRHRPLKLFSKYCHLNYQHLLNVLTREASGPSQNDLVEAVEFNVNKFREDKSEGSEEIDRTCHHIIDSHSVHSSHDLLNFVKRTIEEIHTLNLSYSLSDHNIKLDHIAELDREELRTTLRRSLEGLLRGQIEEKITVLLHALEAHLKEARDSFSKLKEYFQTRTESKNYQKLADGSFEHDITETHHHELNKSLHTVKIYEDLMVEIFSNLTKLEKSNAQYTEASEYVSNEVKKLFNELLESARSSLANTSHLGVFQEDILLDQTPLMTSLNELLEKVNPNPIHLSEKINVHIAKEKWGLVAVEVGDEYVLRDANFKAGLFEAYKQEPVPFYLYNTDSQVLILQVLDIAQERGRIFVEKKEDLEGSHIAAGVHRVHLNVHHDLRRILELLVECHNLRANREHIAGEKTVRNIILTLALFIIDSYVGENDHVNEIALEKRHIQEFINSHKAERSRRIPEEKTQEEEAPQAEQTEPEKNEQEEEKPGEVEKVSQEILEAKENLPEEKGEQVVEENDQAEIVPKEILEAQENLPEESSENREQGEKAENVEEPQSVASEQETQHTEDVTEEAKTEQQEPEESTPKNAAEEEDQEEAKQEEVAVENKGEVGQSTAAANKNKKKKKKR